MSTVIMSFDGFHLIWQIVHSTSLYPIIVQLLLLHTQVLLRVQFLEHIGLVVRMSILDTEVDGSNPSISMFFP